MKPFFDLEYLNSFFLHANAEIQRTESPWALWLDEDRGKRRIMIGRSGEAVATLPHEPKGWLNAQFICQACNAHDAVVSVLTDMGNALGYGSYERFPSTGLDLHVDLATIRKVHAALDLANGVDVGALPL